MISSHSTLGAKILLSMSDIVANPSHHVVMSAVTEPLIKHGHEVTLLSPKNKITKGLSPEAVTDRILFGNQSREEFQDVLKAFSSASDGVVRNGPSYLGQVHMIYSRLCLLANNCVQLFDDEDTLDLLREQRFDLMITLSFVGCDILLAEYLGLPFVIVTSVRRTYVTAEDNFGIPIPSSYVPFSLITPYSDRMSFSERLQNTIFRHVIHPLIEFSATAPIRATKHKLSIRPDRSLRYLMGEAQLWLVHSNFALESGSP